LVVAGICAAQSNHAQSSPAQPGAPQDVLIKNAIVMTVTHGKITNGSVLIRGGKIAAVGTNVSAPPGVAVMDAGGKYLTPGIIDSHSHMALDNDVNEATSPVVPHMMMIDAFEYTDRQIYRALAGG
jgi:imidazolonepropionase-like amidohydrolase